MDQKVCNGLAIAGVVFGALSFFVSGIFALIGFLLSLIAFINIKKVLKMEPNNPYAENTMKLAKIGLVVCIVLFIASILTTAFLTPNMEAGTSLMGPVF